jgi:hypothetical protein
MNKLIFSIILFALYIAPPSGAGGAYAQSASIDPNQVIAFPQFTTVFINMRISDHNSGIWAELLSVKANNSSLDIVVMVTKTSGFSKM